MSLITPLKVTRLSAMIAVSAQAEPVTVFTASEIITMADELPSATAVAVQNGKILDVGSKQALVERYQKTEGFQLNNTFVDKVITPGFVEPHAHIWLFALLANTHFITPAD